MDAPRKVLLNYRNVKTNKFFDFLDVEGFKYPDGTSRHDFWTDDNFLRDNQEFIALVEKYGYKSGEYYNSFKIIVVPPFYTYKITKEGSMYDPVPDPIYEVIKIEFPWKQLARAYAFKIVDDPVRVAVENGTLVVPASDDE